MTPAGARRRAHLLVTAFLLVVGCSAGTDAPADTGGDIATSDAAADLPGRADSGTTPDAADVPGDLAGLEITDSVTPDTPPEDTGSDVAFPPEIAEAVAADSALPDVSDGPVETSWGTITGSCGTITGYLTQPGPDFLVTTYDFTSPDFDADLLYEGAATRYNGENAGGSSLCSEVMSLQVLYECEEALLYKMETEVSYDTQGTIADFVVELAGERVGVSVTRAYKGPTIDEYTVADADSLLTKKLTGLHQAGLNVSPADAWSAELLHVWTLREDWVAPLSQAWEALPGDVRGETVVLVTVETDSQAIVTDNCKPAD